MTEPQSFPNAASNLWDAAGSRSGLPPICPDRIYTVDELAAYGLKRTTLYQAIDPDPDKRGELPRLITLKLGRARRVRGSAFLAFLADLEREG